MSAPPYMKLYVGDYLGDTHHLGALEHGAYLLLLMAMWRAGGTLPAMDTNLCRLARCSPQEWSEIKPTVLAFFKVSRSKLTHKRLTEEMSKYETVSRKRSEAVQAREAKKLREINAYPSSNDVSNGGRLIVKPEPEPEPLREEDATASIVGKPSSRSRSYPDAFERAWKLYPHHENRSSKPDSLAAWKALPSAERDQLHRAIEAFRPKVSQAHGDKGAPAMERWLKRGLHLNFAAAGLELVPAKAFAGPPELRAWIVQATSEAFAASYIDPAGYRPDDRVLEAATNFAADKIRSECAAVLTKARVTVQAKSPAQVAHDRSAA
jgi:uncharacterized protein YdaU (DUF1376 family)